MGRGPGALQPGQACGSVAVLRAVLRGPRWLCPELPGSPVTPGTAVRAPATLSPRDAGVGPLWWLSSFRFCLAWAASLRQRM